MNEIRFAWQNVCRAAMLETNPAKLRALVIWAQAAIFERMETIGQGADMYQERQAMQDGCDGLMVLKREILKWPMSAHPPNGSPAASEPDKSRD